MGLLTDMADGFPLVVEEVEGNKAETNHDVAGDHAFSAAF